MIESILQPELECFLTAEKIADCVRTMGARISRDHAGQSIVMVGVLKGAAIFLADLTRSITLDCTFDFISVASYGEGQHSNGTVRLLKDLDETIENRNVLLIEDILDSGVTLAYLKNLLLSRQPSTLRIATLLDKPSRRKQNIEADYVGFTIPDRFVVGYGMDCAERFRNLPGIYFMPCVI